MNNKGKLTTREMIDKYIKFSISAESMGRIWDAFCTLEKIGVIDTLQWCDFVITCKDWEWDDRLGIVERESGDIIRALDDFRKGDA